MNHLQKLYDSSKLAHQLKIIYMKSLSHQSLEFPINFDERLKVTSGSFFIPEFNLLGCDLDNFTIKVLC